RDDLLAQQISEDHIRIEQRLYLRYEGTDTSLPVILDDAEAMRAAFEQAYSMRFSFLMPDRRLVIESAVAEAIGDESDKTAGSFKSEPREAGDAPARFDTVKIHADDALLDCPLYRSADLRVGDELIGPAIITDANATTLVDPGWLARITERGDIVLERATPRPQRYAIGTQADPVMLEIFNNLFMSIAEQMGYRLQN